MDLQSLEVLFWSEKDISEVESFWITCPQPKTDRCLRCPLLLLVWVPRMEHLTPSLSGGQLTACHPSEPTHPPAAPLRLTALLPVLRSSALISVLLFMQNFKPCSTNPTDHTSTCLQDMKLQPLFLAGGLRHLSRGCHIHAT